MSKRTPFVLAAFFAAISRLYAGTPVAPVDCPIEVATDLIRDLPDPTAYPSAPDVTTLPLDAVRTVTRFRDLDDLSGSVPNLFVGATSLRSFGNVFTLRGLGNTRFFSDPAVILLVDDVPRGDAFTYFQPLYDVERIDVFRGPQPTLFGQNAEAGAISIRTRRADPRQWHGEAAGGWSSYDGQEYRLSLGGPLIRDRLTLELSGFQGLNTGFVENTHLGNRRDDRDALGGRAVLRWTPNSDWDIALGFEGARAQDGSQRLVRLDSDPFRVASDAEGSLNLHQHREWLDITRRFATWQVRSITSHSSWEVDPVEQDLDLSPRRATRSDSRPLLTFFSPGPFAPGLSFGPFPGDAGSFLSTRREQEVWSQELRFESLPPEPPLPLLSKEAGKSVILPLEKPERFWWRAGLFFQRKETDGGTAFRSSAAEYNSLVTRGPDEVFTIPSLFPELFPPLVFRFPTYDYTPYREYLPYERRSSFSLNAETWAGYLQAGGRFGPLDVEAGVRLEYDRKTYEASNEFVFVSESEVDGGYPPALGFAYRNRLVHIRVRSHDADDDFTVAPTLGLKFHLTDQVELFARTTYNFRPGGFSPDSPFLTIAGFDRETVWATEAGVRANAFGGRLQTQLTGYYYTLHDMQAELAFSAAEHGTFNEEHNESFGVEWELAWRIADGLVFSGSIGYNETTDRVRFAPEFTALAALDYAHRCGFRAHVDYTAIGETDFGYGNRYRQDAYGLLNARVGYEWGHFGAYVFARNLTDTRYFTFKDDVLDAGVVGEPRVVGVMAAVKF